MKPSTGPTSTPARALEGKEGGEGVEGGKGSNGCAVGGKEGADRFARSLILYAMAAFASGRENAIDDADALVISRCCSQVSEATH